MIALGNLLHRFNVDSQWTALEAAVWHSSAQVYALETTTVRLDSTTSYGYHQVAEQGLMQHGHSKDHRPDLPQLKLMAALAEPAGQWIASDVYPGQRADEGLYIPLYQRVRSILGRTGLLYIGDCKLVVLATRAQIAAGGDYYLTRLPRNLFSAAQWTHWEAQRDAAAQLTLFWQEGELVGGGCEWWEETLSAAVAGRTVTWQERLQWVYSPSHAARQAQALEQRLQQATTALQALTPAPGRGKRAIRDEETLHARSTAILEQYQVSGLLRPQWEVVEHRHTRYVGRGRGSATRATHEIVQRHYRISRVERLTPAISAAHNGLGWQLQVTSAPPERLTLAEATTAYRGEWHLELDFHRVKERPVGLSPLFVWRDDQIRGLTRLLTLALRLLTRIETQVAQGLTAADESLPGLYEGQPQRTTTQPTAGRLLRALGRAEITLTEIHSPTHMEWYLTPLPPWLTQILTYLKLPPDLYESLTDNSP
ncbi:MAG TPA: transposase [Anaerolineae bacterium]|nr:transposase [Anaerolineae bacterium]HQI87701.1 transposase [Anaerolineae bacterium]